MLELDAINIFPIKSASGITLHSSEIVTRGLAYDRRWMIVDTSARFLTQRQHPRMSLLRTEIQGEMLVLHFPDNEGLHINLARNDGPSISVQVWDDQVDAINAFPEADAWLSRALGEPVRLVYMPEGTNRQVDTNYAMQGDITSFSDGFPFLLITQASLDDLNQRMERPVPMERFRPNLVVSGATPYAEDNWKRIRIGDIDFEVVKPCSRCVIPSIDINTGTRAADSEPLRTLASYRRQKGKVYFGQNLIHRGLGQISVGDPIEIIE